MKDSNAELIMLVDVVDYGSETEAFNTDYGPVNPAITDAYGRDRYAVFKIVEELFSGDLPTQVQEELIRARDNQTQIPIALAPLLNSLHEALEPEESEEPEVEEKEPILLSWRGNLPSAPTLLDQSTAVIISTANGLIVELVIQVMNLLALLQVIPLI